LESALVHTFGVFLLTGGFTRPKGFAASFADMSGIENHKGRRTRGESTLTIVRFPRSRSVTIFAGMTRAVEYGFLAAGVTVAVLAAIQSIATVAGWLSGFRQLHFF
jgi:hypothetical protein